MTTEQAIRHAIDCNATDYNELQADLLWHAHKLATGRDCLGAPCPDLVDTLKVPSVLTRALRHATPATHNAILGALATC